MYTESNRGSQVVVISKMVGIYRWPLDTDSRYIQMTVQSGLVIVGTRKYLQKAYVVIHGMAKVLTESACRMINVVLWKSMFVNPLNIQEIEFHFSVTE